MVSESLFQGTVLSFHRTKVMKRPFAFDPQVLAPFCTPSFLAALRSLMLELVGQVK